tara:strand:+ start:15556 stop:16200 length:645 start_codon:yes stop_codon:yes gene_type:complete
MVENLADTANSISQFLGELSTKILEREIKNMAKILIHDHKTSLSPVKIALRYIQFRHSAVIFRNQITIITTSQVMHDIQKKKIIKKVALAIANARQDICNYALRKCDSKTKQLCKSLSIGHVNNTSLFVNKLESLNIFEYVPAEHINLIYNENKKVVKSCVTKLQNLWLKFFIVILKLVPENDYKYTLFENVNKCIRTKKFEQIYLKKLLLKSK